jgi:hypothetical protein
MMKIPLMAMMSAPSVVQMTGLPPHSVLHLPHARMGREARDYITKPSQDLAMVCALAGVDMDAVNDRFRAKIEKLGTLRGCCRIAKRKCLQICVRHR